MEKPHLRFTLPILLLLPLWISTVFSSLPSKYSLGIAPQDESYYKSNVIKCKDGSKKFSKEQLNDDFCDCPDGTDEPGTSACPEGKFYCINAGHIPLTVFSSRVNDGICDCCDGSDEYDGTVKCPNTCWEAGKAARENMNKKIQVYKEGVIIRKKEVEKAKEAFAKDEEQLSKLKSEEKILKELVDKLKEHKERIEKAEEEERLKKEEENRQREAEMEANKEEKVDKFEVNTDKEEKVDKVEVNTNKEEKVDDLEMNTNKDEKFDKVPRDPVDGVHNESPEQVASEVFHDTEGGEKFEANHGVDHDAIQGHGYDDIYHDESAHHIGDEYYSNIAYQEGKDQDGTVLEDANTGSSSDATKQEQGGSDDTSGLSKEELGRLVASRWTGGDTKPKSDEDTTDKQDEVSSTVKDVDQQDTYTSANEEDGNGYASEAEDDRHKYDDDHDDFDDDVEEEYADDHVEPEGSYNPDEDDKIDYSDSIDSSSSSWLDKIKQTVQTILSSFNFFKIPVDLSEAGRVRKEYEDSKSKLSKVQSRISTLTEKLKHDFGRDKEFYSFYDRCFEHKQNKYVYKVCPFKQASQVEGHSNTRLGNWDKFEESYRVMQFTNGEKCWNGPDRSLKVRLRCGLTVELTDVDEPSRCEYVAFLSTPALCLEDKLKELQQKLEQMNSKQPQGRDEL